MCYAVVWQHVMSRYGVCAVWCAELDSRSAQHTAHSNFTDCFNISVTLARLNCKLPDDVVDRNM
jgi:hypothetical protein